MAAPGAPSDHDLDDEDDGESDEDEYEDVLPEAHPAFRRAFADPLYDDQGDELAPFGSDEGWDAMAEIVADLAPLADDTTLRDLAARLLDWDDADFADTDLASTGESDFVMTGVAFTILRLTGRIDEEGRRWVLAALRRQQARYGDGLPVLRRMVDDLEALPGLAQPEPAPRTSRS